jgi:hypothetical protein
MTINEAEVWAGIVTLDPEREWLTPPPKHLTSLAFQLGHGREDPNESEPTTWSGWERSFFIRVLHEARITQQTVAFVRELSHGHRSSPGPGVGLVRELHDLRVRVDALEEEVDLLRSQLGRPEIAVEDPFADWCARHERELADHPDEFVAVSLGQGIVAAAKDQVEFQAQLRRFDRATRRTFYLAHTSTLLP